MINIALMKLRARNPFQEQSIDNLLLVYFGDYIVKTRGPLARPQQGPDGYAITQEVR